MQDGAVFWSALDKRYRPVTILICQYILQSDPGFHEVHRVAALRENVHQNTLLGHVRSPSPSSGQEGYHVLLPNFHSMLNGLTSDAQAKRVPLYWDLLVDCKELVVVCT